MKFKIVDDHPSPRGKEPSEIHSIVEALYHITDGQAVRVECLDVAEMDRVYYGVRQVLWRKKINAQVWCRRVTKGETAMYVFWRDGYGPQSQDKSAPTGKE
jgi:hypothetical protein